VSRIDEYKERLGTLKNWDKYLLKESGLPGPRGNLELAQAVADLGDRSLFDRYTTYTVNKAPVNSPYEFLAFCGVVGLGRLLAEGDTSLFELLRKHASDPRWRIREAVAMALQKIGDKNMDSLLAEMQKWIDGTPLEQRAAAAALCEPRLLTQERHAREVLQILNKITSSLLLPLIAPREDILVLRKGLGYCWSVAVAALPEEGKSLMEKWMLLKNNDIGWIMRENLKKNRLVRLDPTWVDYCLKTFVGN